MSDERRSLWCDGFYSYFDFRAIFYTSYKPITAFCDVTIILLTGWVNELMAGGLGGGKGFMFFICNMELTTEGQGIVK